MTDQDNSKNRPNQQADTPSRRAALKKVLVGGAAAGALPTQWTRPVAEAIVLPAHAQISEPPTGLHFRGTVVVTITENAGMTSTSVPNPGSYEYDTSVTLDNEGNTVVRAAITTMSGDAVSYGETASFDYDGGRADIQVLTKNPCGSEPISTTVKLTALTSSSIVVTFGDETGTVVLAPSATRKLLRDDPVGNPPKACT